MPELKVFISSTYEDLKPYREKINDFFKDGIPDVLFKGMETMSASDTRPIDVCRQKVEDSNVFILVIGKRYGWIPDDLAKNPNQLSITELEYEWAKNHYANKPGNTLLCFVADKNTELPGDTDNDAAVKEAKAAKLTTFIRKVQSEAGIVPTKGFITADDLVKQINKALFNKYASLPKAKELNMDSAYCCNRSDNYRIFKTAPRWDNSFNLFLAVGSRDDLLENFFQRLVIFEYHGRADSLKALPQRPTTIDAEKCLREHIEKIAFEIDPLQNTVSITEAISRYSQHHSGNIYFKTDVSVMEVEELQDYLAYLKQLFVAMQQQTGSLTGVQLLVFVYTNQETLHDKLEFEGCNDLGDFKDIGQQDVKDWLADISISQDDDIQEDIITQYMLSPGDSLYKFQYTMKQARPKLREIIKLYNDNDPGLLKLIN